MGKVKRMQAKIDGLRAALYVIMNEIIELRKQLTFCYHCGNIYNAALKTGNCGICNAHNHVYKDGECVTCGEKKDD